MQKTQTDRLECGHWLKPRQNVTNVPLLSFSALRYSVYETGLFESSVNGIWILYSPLLSFLYRHETSPELGSSQTASVFLTNAKQPPKEKKIEKRKKSGLNILLGKGGWRSNGKGKCIREPRGGGVRPAAISSCPVLCFQAHRTVSGEGPFQLPPSSAPEGSLLPGVSSFTLLRMLWSRVRCPYPAALTLPS